MDLAALFSGGKDSVFSIYKAQALGHHVKCLITLVPSSDESHLLHHPNILLTELQAESLGLPQIISSAKSPDTKSELELLRTALIEAKSKYGITGLVHGGILSEFQKARFEGTARDLGLDVLAPHWKRVQKQYMHEIVSSGIVFIISSVSCDGLDKSWLGRKITRDDLHQLEILSEKYKFNLSFEGGEAETFVVDCPLFSNPIKVIESRTYWDGYRGRFEILQAEIGQ